MVKTKVLIAVKTYPTVSGKYDELVCTAGFREDGTWIRIYPVPFRKKEYDQQYKKYDWIEIDLDKNERDSRPESFRPHDHDTEFKYLGHIDTKFSWEERKKYVLAKVYYNMTELIDEAHNKKIATSLAVFKPSQIIDFTVEEVSREWDSKKLATLEKERQQMNLFKYPEDPFKVVNKLPYKFYYHFEDNQGRRSKMMIEDWEIGQLFWNCLQRNSNDEFKAIQDVRKKYYDNFAKTKDLYFFLGTSLLYHFKSKNPFMIIGAFYPKHVQQLRLF